MKKLFLFFVILTSLLLPNPPAYAEEKNLLQNPGFEESTNHYTFWEKRVWQQESNPSVVTVTSTLARSGNTSAMISNHQATDARLVQTVSVTPSTLYKISGWIKTENVSTAGKGANLSVWMLMQTSKDLKGTRDWTQVSLYGKTGPNQQILELTFGLGSHGSLTTGTAYFDDLSIEKVTNVPKGETLVNLYNPQTNSGGTGSGNSPGAGFLTLVFTFLLLSIGLVSFFVFKKSKSHPAAELPQQESTPASLGAKTPEKNADPIKPFKVDKKDLLIMGAMTLVYLAIALFNLGSTQVPESFWKPTQLGESFIVNFDKEYDLSKIAYYAGVGDLTLRVEAPSTEHGFTTVATLEQSVHEILRWRSSDAVVKTKTLKFTVDKTGGNINEIVFFEAGKEDPIQGFSIIKTSETSKDTSTPVENLFDEQDVGDYTQNYMTSSYFDEVYHPRTAFEYLNRMEITETTHPPLGKIFIALGIYLFGMNPFGWRIMGTLFGAAMIPAMYLFGKKIFSKKLYAFISAFLIMFDCMHFAQTRIGTIDSYPTLFIILAYFFMYNSFIHKSYHVGFKQSLKPLLLAGIFWGLGAASKWTALATGGGLAVLYFTSKIMEYLDFKKAASFKCKNRKKKATLPEWTKHFVKKNIVYTSLWCVVFFVVIPIIIYSASYLPIITLPGSNHHLGEIWESQKGMFSYHAYLPDPHAYESPAYSWPLMLKPLIEYRDLSLPPDQLSTMYVLGNPAVFWFGIVCVFLTLIIGILKKDKKAFILIVAFAFQYLPWFNVSRCIFIYHFFTSVPFMILCTVYILKFIKDDLPFIIGKAFISKKAESNASTVCTLFVYEYLAIVAVAFILLYPAISGMVVDSGYLELVEWLNVH